MKEAHHVSAHQNGLSVTVGSDGVWLHFDACDGRSAALNISDDFIARLGGPIVRSALREWRRDMLDTAQPNEFERGLLAKADKGNVHKCGTESCNHASDCAVHNEPAYPNGDCTCGASK